MEKKKENIPTIGERIIAEAFDGWEDFRLYNLREEIWTMAYESIKATVLLCDREHMSNTHGSPALYADLQDKIVRDEADYIRDMFFIESLHLFARSLTKFLTEWAARSSVHAFFEMHTGRCTLPECELYQAQLEDEQDAIAAQIDAGVEDP